MFNFPGHDLNRCKQRVQADGGAEELVGQALIVILLLQAGLAKTTRPQDQPVVINRNLHITAARRITQSQTPDTESKTAGLACASCIKNHFLFHEFTGSTKGPGQINKPQIFCQ